MVVFLESVSVLRRGRSCRIPPVGIPLGLAPRRVG
jgi:hypothetical protein